MSLHLDAKPPYVRGEFGVTYDIGGGIPDVDGHLRTLTDAHGADHPDVDELLEVRTILARQEDA